MEQTDNKTTVLERRLDKQLNRTISMLAKMDRIAKGEERMVLRDLPHPE